MAAKNIAAVYDLIQNLEQLKDIRAITDAMTAGTQTLVAVAN
jgi:hypothetical protein